VVGVARDVVDVVCGRSSAELLATWSTWSELGDAGPRTCSRSASYMEV